MVDELIDNIGDSTVSIDWECKTIDIEDNYHCIFFEFEDLDKFIETLQKIKIKIEGEVKVND